MWFIADRLDCVHFQGFVFNVLVAVEESEEHSGILLHVEDDWSLRAAETHQGSRGGNQTKTSLHSQLVRALDHQLKTVIKTLKTKLKQVYIPN